MDPMNFNHINKNLTVLFFFFYHKLMVSYRWKYKKYRKIYLGLNMSSIFLTVVESALSPFFIGTLPATGISQIKSNNVNSFINSMIRCWFNLHLIYGENILLSDLKVLDDIVRDLCPPINNVSNIYSKLYVRDWTKLFIC